MSDTDYIGLLRDALRGSNRDYTRGPIRKSAGDTFTPMIINLICFWVIQIPLALYLAETAGLGARGVFAAITVAESIIALLAFWVFRRGRWMQPHD